MSTKKESVRKQYSAPKLIVYGTVQEITLKVTGRTDGNGTKSLV